MYTLKKSLGQHFLKDQAIVNRIVDALRKESFQRLLEVGPGAGALTSHLLALPDIDFKAVELDDEKIQYLRKTFPSIRDKIIASDFLQISMPFDQSFIVIGNFPYNISSQILFKILDWKEHVPVSIGMFQKEVAERAASKPNTKAYGVLSVLVQAYYDVEYLFDVPPSAFNPPPKVMSGVIRLQRKTNTPDYTSEKAFRLLVKTAFNQRRKTLRNALKSIFPQDALQDEIFNRRAETLSVEEFAALTYKMQ